MPEERLLTISSSSHLAPDDVARHSFGTVRRGFDPNEVRAYLESVAAVMRGVAEQERQLLQELAAAEDRAAHPVLDEATLAAAIGNETARVLRSAHEVAAEMVAKAEAEANRFLTEAHEEIDQARRQTEERLAEQSAASQAAAEELRARTDQQIAQGLEEARREAEDLLEQARDACRTMVDEAQGLRARVLADLSRRRKVLHAQIEQLRAGRERLAETVDEVRRSVDAIAGDLFVAEDNARLAAEAAGREVMDRPDEETPEELAEQLLADEEMAVADLDPSLAVEPDPGSDEPTDGGEPSEASPVDALFAKIRAAREETPEPTAVPAEPESAAEPVEEAPTPVADAGSPDDAEDTEDTDTDTGTEDAATEDVHTEDAGPVDDAEEDGPPEERNPLAVRRDEMIDPIVVTLSRRLKRTLQDTQNELLDRLRSNGSTWSVDLLPSEVEHLDSYATAALPALEQASAAGVSFAGGRKEGPKSDILLGIAHELAQAVVGPLRRRLTDDSGLDGADESVVAEHVGSAFREWRGERIERLAGDHIVAAFSAGTLGAVGGRSSAQLEWLAVADPGDVPCPDCEDNGLNGSQKPGEEFPTGHRHPPAHPGCRCLLVVSST